MTDWYQERYRQAEELRKDGQFAEALALFNELGQQNDDAFVGWRRAFCLRKLGHTHEALNVASQVAENFPEDEWVGREYAWCIYTHNLKPAQSDQDLPRVRKIARQIVELVDDPFIKKLVTFIVIDVAKARADWNLVNTCCNWIKTDDLSDEPTDFGERKGMSELERWYFAKVKAVIKLERWDEAECCAREAAEHFPRKTDFSRWRAQALAGNGHFEEAETELQALIRKGNAPWYVLADLARVTAQLGKPAEALRIASEAARTRGEDQAKVNLFALLAELALETGQAQTAALHVALVKAIREREGWPIKAELVELEQEMQMHLSDEQTHDIPSDPRQLLKLCHRAWDEIMLSGQERYYGTVCRLPEEKNFGFIKPDDGTDDVFVLLRDVPRSAQEVGARVEYALESSYDHKKERESVRAVHVRLVE
jgi:cold shock CspA family protein/Flp pilus assembly protein TadD